MRKTFFYLYFGVFIFLSIPALNFAGVRYGQLFIILTFLLVFIDDYNQKKVDWFILGYFFVGVVLLSLISLNSIFGKVEEVKYIIKYLFVFPSAFYIGIKSLQKIGTKDFIFILEFSVFLYFIIAYLVFFGFFPESFLIYRVGYGGVKYLDFQGVFLEAGALAMVSYLMLLVAVLLRTEFKIFPKNKIYLYLFYLFCFLSLLLTKNKTIWISLLLILLTLPIFKIFFMLYYSNYFQPKQKVLENRVLKMFMHLDATKLIFIFIITIIILYTINELLQEPIITAQIIKIKLTQERGKAFEYAIKLLVESDWMGGYGFGYIEYYFSNLHTNIIGLGKGSGMMFNSFLDLWISVGIAGVLFHLGLFYISFSKEYFLTIIIPIILFTYNNFNPFLGEEYHYIFLGLSYGFVQKYVKKRVEYI